MGEENKTLLTIEVEEAIQDAFLTDSYLRNRISAGVAKRAAGVATRAIRAAGGVVVRKEDLRAVVGAAGYYPLDDVNDALDRIQEALGDA